MTGYSIYTSQTSTARVLSIKSGGPSPLWTRRQTYVGATAVSVLSSFHFVPDLAFFFHTRFMYGMPLY